MFQTRLFFHIAPNLLSPVCNGFFIPLRRWFDGLLWCPLQFFEQARYMRFMIRHAKFDLDHFSNSSTRPHIAAKPI